MGQRNSRIGRDGHRRAHAGNDLERDAGAGQGFGLFAAATEDERIAALQPYDPAAAPRVHDQERVDPLLGQRVVAGSLTRVDTPRARGLVEESRVDQPVVHDDLSSPQELEPTHRHEPGIAGARADERDRADSHDSAPSSSSSRCLASSRPRSTISRRTSGPSARRHASAVTGRPAARSSRLASAAIEASVV